MGSEIIDNLVPSDIPHELKAVERFKLLLTVVKH